MPKHAFLSQAAWSAVLGAALFSLTLPALSDNPPSNLTARTPPSNAIWADSLRLESVINEGGPVRPGLSGWGRPITLRGVTYAHGIGVHGVSEMTIDLNGGATEFQCLVGIDDDVQKNGSVDCTVIVDGHTAFDSGRLVGGMAPQFVTVPLRGAMTLTLHVVHVGDGDDFADNADWAGALIQLVPGAHAQPETQLLPMMGEAPTAVADTPLPAIHGPQIVGFSPGRPFLFRIPATGHAPLSYAASGLPTGLTIDRTTGSITGTGPAAGSTRVEITVTNSLGKAGRLLTLVGGTGQPARTPPMGWDAYEVYGDSVTDAQVRAAADQLVADGLAAHGYDYIILGDSWQGKRGSDGVLLPNRRFPDMKALADYIHDKGLKFGLYSAANSQTCSGYVGSLGYETQDAETFASWGVDYLTYDWCPDKAAAQGDPQAGFAAMGRALAQVPRDIFYAIRLPQQRPEPAHTDDNSFEASSGLYDNDSVIMKDAIARSGHAADFGPGHWGALGLLMVGRFGYPETHLTKLMPGEQMTQMSLWCLFSAPLFLSCDLAHLNPNLQNHDTTLLLTNDEVLALDQDPVGKAPVLISNDFGRTVWMKSLADGRVAVAFVNGTNQTQSQRVAWSSLKLTGSQPVRDLWKHKNLGNFSEGFNTPVPAHGVVLVIVGRLQINSEQ